MCNISGLLFPVNRPLIAKVWCQTFCDVRDRIEKRKHILCDFELKKINCYQILILNMLWKNIHNIQFWRIQSLSTEVTKLLLSGTNARKICYINGWTYHWAWLGPSLCPFTFVWLVQVSHSEIISRIPLRTQELKPALIASNYGLRGHNQTA